MSFLLQAYLLDRYGPRLTVAQLAEAIGMPVGTVRNRISDGTLGVRTYKDAGRRWADFRDVATYLDVKRAASEAAWEETGELETADT